MTECQSSNACIIFIKWPEAGQVKTRIAKGSNNETALALYKLCTQEIVKELTRPDQWRLIIAYSPATKAAAVQQWLLPISKDCAFTPQLSHPDLGARMGHSIREALNLGSQKVVLVGSDIPDLSSKVVTAAFSALGGSQVVLGPAKDGGYYLIGGSTMPDPVLQGIEWSTSTVLQATMRNCLELGIKADSHSLPCLRDLDTVEDTLEWLDSAKPSLLRDSIQRLFDQSGR